MKKIIILIQVLFLLSCHKEDIQDLQPDIITSLIGKIDNWSMGSDKIIKFGDEYSTKIFDSSSIDTNGFFNIKYLTVPDDKYLSSIDSSFSYKGINISNHKARVYFGLIMVYSPIHNNKIGFVYKGNYDISKTPYKIGDYKFLYYYVNENVTLKGNSTITVLGDVIQVNFNLNFVKGWNRLLNRIISTNSKVTSGEIITSPATPDSLCFYED
jgi:hypothetical protein